MDWADRRRFFIVLLLLAVFAAVVASVLIATFYQAPSCSDAKQNQGESGVDCGGPCTVLCRADMQPPTVLFTQTISGALGRTDIIAEVENKNAGGAAKAVPYTIMLYGADQSLVGETAGVVDLPPSAVVPVFVPGVASGTTTAARAFLTIDPSTIAWYRYTDTRTLPSVSSVALKGAADAPRVEAVLGNPSTRPLAGVRAVALVHGKGGNVIAASSTLIPQIRGQGTATATFTWSRAFSEVPLSVEVVPVLALP